MHTGAVILSVTLLFGWTAANTKFEDCGSTGNVLKFQVLDCEEPPCIIALKTNVTALLHFKTNEDDEAIENLTSSFSIKLTPEIEIPFPNIRKDVCSRLMNAPAEVTNDSTAKECPITPGSEVVYYTVLEINDEYPMIKSDIKWTLTDQVNNTVACVEFSFELI